jgi:hypothetical protein
LPQFIGGRAAGASLGGSALENELRVELDPSWKLQRLGIAAFVQDELALAIDGAAAQ